MASKPAWTPACEQAFQLLQGLDPPLPSEVQRCLSQLAERRPQEADSAQWGWNSEHQNLPCVRTVGRAAGDKVMDFPVDTDTTQVFTTSGKLSRPDTR